MREIEITLNECIELTKLDPRYDRLTLADVTAQYFLILGNERATTILDAVRHHEKVSVVVVP